MSFTNDDKEWLQSWFRAELGAGFKDLESRSRDLESRFTALESRFTALESGIKALASGVKDLDSGNKDLESRFTALESGIKDLESRLTARFSADLEVMETKLLTEFHKWASPTEMRLRSHSLAIQAMDLEIGNMKDRLDRLDPPIPPQ